MSVTAPRKVPSPADAPQLTAKDLVREVKRRKGRLYRMREWAVFVIAEDEALATWLLKLGGSPYLPAGLQRKSMSGSYTDAKGGKPKWDIYIHAIPVLGEETVWEAAGEAKAELYVVPGA